MVPWTLFIGVAAGSHILAEMNGKKEITFLTKPLTMLLIIGMTASAPLVWSTSYRFIVLTGLIFSLGGDIFLMLRRERFLPGLISFLFAHLIYIYAFTLHGWTISVPASAFVLVLAVTFLVVIRKGLGKFLIPVLFYMTAIGFMNIVAVSKALSSGTPAAWAGAAGAFLFMISDTFLAIRKFRGPYYWSPLCVMTTYFTAQWLIALSVFENL